MKSKIRIYPGNVIVDFEDPITRRINGSLMIDMMGDYGQIKLLRGSGILKDLNQEAILEIQKKLNLKEVRFLMEPYFFQNLTRSQT